ncbi:MAG TPA: ribosomal L7Ae/L30e/S12e/Gadd45 family protein [Gemmatimonadales bacterium]|jgi:ribosomal protein L7Ae-like RNA K-turn-binding protein|nr:ribosomal L7Ae/L30e/S12e/Gadd45 family protein [Gemmatimonadales bacterium]
MSGVLGLLGLGLRGRNVAVGVDAVRKELQANRLGCVVVAADASPRAVEKVVRLAEARKVPLVRGPGAEEIGARLGRPPVMAVGVRDRGLAQGVLRAASTEE